MSLFFYMACTFYLFFLKIQKKTYENYIINTLYQNQDPIPGKMATSRCLFSFWLDEYLVDAIVKESGP